MTPVSIIIPAWNEAKTLEATFEALLAVDYDKAKIELIIVAGGDDNTYELARNLMVSKNVFARHLVIPQGRRGTKNAAIQQGIREAHNPIIVLLDADTLVILSNVPGLLRDASDEESLIPHIPRSQAQEHLDRYAKGRMKRKILGAIEALDDGVGQVIIADGRVTQPVRRALAGRGTVIE